MDDRLKSQTIYRGHDPVMGEMLEDVLVTAGFDARLIGTRNAALLGAGQQIMQLRIEVPASEAEEAAEVLEAVLSGVEGEGEDDEDEEFYLGDEEAPGDAPTVDRPEGASADEYQPPRKLESSGSEKQEKEAARPPETPKKRALAAGLPVVMPGLGQIYGGRPWAGLVLMAGLISSFVFGSVVGDFTMFGVGYLFALLMDVIAGQLAAVAFNKGTKTGVGLQLAYGLAEVALVGGAAALAIQLVE